MVVPDLSDGNTPPIEPEKKVDASGGGVWGPVFFLNLDDPSNFRFIMNALSRQRSSPPEWTPEMKEASRAEAEELWGEEESDYQ